MIQQRLKCLIVDDEHDAVEILVNYVTNHPDLILTKATTEPLKVEKLVTRYRPDILFADMQMEGLHGAELIARLHSKLAIVCCTAHVEETAATFPFDGVAYLLKPFDQFHFDGAIAKVKRWKYAGRLLAEEEEDYTVKDELMMSFRTCGGLNRRIHLSLVDIEWIRAKKDDCDIAITEGIICVSESLAELRKRLPAQKFMQVHRSYIVPLNRIKAIGKNKKIVLRNVENAIDIPIGKAFRRDLKAFFNQTF